jgi:hypothetical protein
MTINVRCLVEAVQVTAAEVTYYTAPPNTRTLIDKLTGTNTNVGAVTITVSLVASGNSVGVGSQIVRTRALAAGETYGFPELVGHVLNPGDFISIAASSAASVNVRISGREVV